MPATHSFTQYQTSSGIRVHRIPLEAFPNFWAYACLVQLDRWNVLIDSGSGSEMSNTGLEDGLAKAGLSVSDLTHILITHGHIDHYGGLSYLRERTRAKIGVHELDLPIITTHEARLAILSHKLETYLTQAGVSPTHRSELLTMYRYTKSLYHSVSVDFTYQACNMQVGPFELLHVPGHCPGHVALKLDDVIFCGDLILKKITPHQSPEDLLPYMGVEHYLESLSAFERWANDPALTLNGHDDPITDLFEGIATVRTGILRRVEQTLTSLSEPHTLVEVTERVYGEQNGYNALLVIEKIGAYVEYLAQCGLIEIVNLEELQRDPLSAIKYRRIEQDEKHRNSKLPDLEPVI